MTGVPRRLLGRSPIERSTPGTCVPDVDGSVRSIAAADLDRRRGVTTVNGIGPRESSVSRCRRAQLLPGFRIAPAACPLARSPVLQYVHSIRLCLDVNRVRRAIFEQCLRLRWTLASGCLGRVRTPRLAWIVCRAGLGTGRASGCERETAGRRVPGGRMSRPIASNPAPQRRHSPRARPGWILRWHRAAPAAAMASHGEQCRSLLTGDGARVANQHASRTGSSTP